MKYLIIGHARHGKDTVAEMLRDQLKLTFHSSSEFCGRAALWDSWGKERYSTFEDMFADRVNYRETWSNLINAYNTPDGARLAREILKDSDMYVGMRDAGEFEACQAENMFDLVIWVDRSQHLPPESNPKMTMTSDMANYHLFNNGSLQDLKFSVRVLANHITNMQLTQQQSKNAIMEMPEISSEFDEPVDLGSMPHNAVQILDQGYGLCVDVNGTDDDIAEAARISYGRGTSASRNNEGLLRYLYMNSHTSPFEMVGIKVQMRLPIFIMRQLVRHRTASLNEYSGRYSVMPRMFYLPNKEDMCYQHGTNHQMSGMPMEDKYASICRAEIKMASDAAFDAYERQLARGLSREMARIILPINTYTEVVWKMDLHNLLHLIRLRNDSHAQPEIRAYAAWLADLVEQNFPATFAAFQRKMSMVSLTKDQMFALFANIGRDDLPKSEREQVEKLQRELQQKTTTALSDML